MGTKLYVYVAGPYTKPDPPINTKKAIDFGNWLLDHGHRPIVPHLSLFQHMQKERPWQEWLDIDFDMITRCCDVLIRLPGESSGADMEVQHARTLGMPVLMVEFADGWQHRILGWLEDVADSLEAKGKL